MLFGFLLTLVSILLARSLCRMVRRLIFVLYICRLVLLLFVVIVGLRIILGPRILTLRRRVQSVLLLMASLLLVTRLLLLKSVRLRKLWLRRDKPLTPSPSTNETFGLVTCGVGDPAPSDPPPECPETRTPYTHRRLMVGSRSVLGCRRAFGPRCPWYNS